MKQIKRAFIPQEDIAPSSKPKDAFLRFFSGRHQKRDSFGRYTELQRSVFSHTLATADGRLIYVKNPKAGCSTVAHLLYEYENGHMYEGDIHYAPILKVIEKWPHLRDIPEKTISFSTVRNPERRCVSGFFDFFIKQQNPEAPKHLKDIEVFGFSLKADNHYRFDVYLDYVEAYFEYSMLRTDRHFRPQHINLGHREIELSYISRVETLDADLQHVAERAGVTFRTSDGISKRIKNQSGSSQFVPSTSQRRKIEILYYKDYELYGY